MKGERRRVKFFFKGEKERESREREGGERGE